MENDQKVLAWVSQQAHARQRMRASALALLDRGIQCRHERIATLRLIAAIELGAAVRAEQWKYCEEVVARDHNGVLRDLLSRVVPARTVG